MALLPDGKDGSRWCIAEIGDGLVAIIENPGEDRERVHFKYNGRNSRELVVIQEQVLESNKLTEEQKFFAGFWMGYFYAHLGSVQTH